MSPAILDRLGLSPEEWSAIALSLRVAGVATLASLGPGLAVAWVLARRRFPGRALLDGLVHLPLILPPVVTGYLLLLAFGRRVVALRYGRGRLRRDLRGRWHGDRSGTDE